MKYIVTAIQGKHHLVLFPASRDHSSMWGNIEVNYPTATLISAGKLYIEPMDRDPSVYYVNLTPGSVTLQLEMRTPEKFQQHYNLAFPLLGEKLDFIVNERQAYSSDLSLVMQNRKGIPATLTLQFLPEDRCCRQAKVQLAGLDYYETICFWQGLKHI